VARNKTCAIEILDEVGSAEPSYLTVVHNMMVHLLLRTLTEPSPEDIVGVLELEGFGEETHERVMEQYPAVASAFNKDIEMPTAEDVNAAVAPPPRMTNPVIPPRDNR
jgi:hypothetical protein